MRSWKLQDAKARLSEVVKEAALHGPQKISVRGQPVVVVLSIQEYNQLLKPKVSFVEFMRASPLVGIKLDLKRDPSLTRDIDL